MVLKYFLKKVTLSVIGSHELVVLLHRFRQKLKLRSFLLGKLISLLGDTVALRRKLVNFYLIKYEVSQVFFIERHLLQLCKTGWVALFVSYQVPIDLFNGWMVQEIQ
jgi:hypothetical protein